MRNARAHSFHEFPCDCGVFVVSLKSSATSKDAEPTDLRIDYTRCDTRAEAATRLPSQMGISGAVDGGQPSDEEIAISEFSVPRGQRLSARGVRVICWFGRGSCLIKTSVRNLFISVITTCRQIVNSYLGTSFFVVSVLLPLSLSASTNGRISGKTLDPRGVPVIGAHLKLLNSSGAVVGEGNTDAQGSFSLGDVDPGEYRLTAEEPTFVSMTLDISVFRGQQKLVTLQFRQLASVSQAITVAASFPSSLTPDPAQSIIIHDQVMDANPGRPGAPISIPGFPIETASGGIKAPQYFAPGVAGDHGEPIAQYFQIGDFLYPNNLPANAHGNGYADPNFLIPPTIEAVTVDGGAFNVREGNNSVDLAASYVPRQRFNSFVQISGDYRDVDVMAGWSSSNPKTDAWLAMETSFGNGFLERLEHRQQYKLNGLRRFVFRKTQVGRLRHWLLRVLRHSGTDSDQRAGTRRHN
jgi:hypothetical protein